MKESLKSSIVCTYNKIENFVSEHEFLQYFVFGFLVCFFLFIAIAVPLSSILLGVLVSPWLFFTLFITIPFDIALVMYINKH